MTYYEAEEILNHKPTSLFNYKDWIFYISIYKQFGWRPPCLLYVETELHKIKIPEKYHSQELILALKLV